MHKIWSYLKQILDYILFRDENNFINPFLQVGSVSNEKSTGSGGPNINGSDRILILAYKAVLRIRIIRFVYFRSDQDPFFHETDLTIRIRFKIKRIRNTDKGMWKIFPSHICWDILCIISLCNLLLSVYAYWSSCRTIRTVHIYNKMFLNSGAFVPFVCR